MEYSSGAGRGLPNVREWRSLNEAITWLGVSLPVPLGVEDVLPEFHVSERRAGAHGEPLETRGRQLTARFGDDSCTDVSVWSPGHPQAEMPGLDVARATLTTYVANRSEVGSVDQQQSLLADVRRRAYRADDVQIDVDGRRLPTLTAAYDDRRCSVFRRADDGAMVAICVRGTQESRASYVTVRGRPRRVTSIS